MHGWLFVAACAAFLAACGDDGAAADTSTDSAVDAATDSAMDSAVDAAMDSTVDAATDGDALPPDTTPTDGGVVDFDIRIDFGNWTADPSGNWVLMPLGTMDMRIDGLVDFTTGVATPVSLSSDPEWISSGGDASNWTMGDVDWLPQIVAQDAWGGNIVGNVVRFEGLPGPVRVEVVAASGFPREDMSITIDGAPTTTTHAGRTDADSAAWNAETDCTDMGDWLVWPSVVPVGGAIEIRLTPGLLSAVRLSAP